MTKQPSAVIIPFRPRGAPEPSPDEPLDFDDEEAAIEAIEKMAAELLAD